MNALYSSPVPIGGPGPPPHYVSFFIFTAVEILSVVTSSSYRHFEELSKWGGGRGREKRRRRRMWSLTSPPPRCSSPCSPAVSRGQHLTHRMAVRRWASLRPPSPPPPPPPPKQPTITPDVSCHRIYLFFFFVEEKKGGNDWFCAIFFRTTLHSNLP